MINKKLSLKTKQAGFVLGAALLAALTENVSYAEGVRVGFFITPPVVVVAPPVIVVPAPVVAPVVVVQDDYVYYPDYEVYYSSSRHQYAYLEDGAWVSRPAPRGVSVDVLFASPSVRMDFHDSPERHHAEMSKRYPRNWKSSGEHQDRRENIRMPASDDNGKRDRDKR